jgi:hypothetical protein
MTLCMVVLMMLHLVVLLLLLLHLEVSVGILHQVCFQEVLGVLLLHDKEDR